MQVKGLEMGGYLAQTSPPRGLQYAVGDRGGCHHYGLDIAEQNFRTWVDSLTICSWHRPFVSRYGRDLIGGSEDYQRHYLFNHICVSVNSKFISNDKAREVLLHDNDSVRIIPIITGG